MPTYEVTDPDTGKKLRLTGDSPPTEAELEEIFGTKSTRGTSFDDPRSGLVSMGVDLVREGTGLPGLVGLIRGAGAAVVPGGDDFTEAATKGIEGTRQALSVPATPRGEALKEGVGGVVEGAAKVARRVPAALATTDLDTRGAFPDPMSFEQKRDIREDIVESGVGPFLGESADVMGAPPAVSAALETLPTAIAAALGFGAARALPRAVRSDVAEVENLARQRGIDLDSATPANVREIRQIANELTDQQQQRIAEFREAGIENPTRAQVTQSADDFQLQQELRKRSGRVRDTLESQEAALSQRLDEGIESTQGRAVQSGSTVVDEVVGRSTRLDDEIGDLYRQARERATGDVDLSRFTRKVLDNLDSDGAADGLFSAVRGELRRRGVIDEKGNIVGNVDVATSEEIRKFINAQFDPKNRTFTNSQIHVLKDVLDDDVFRAAGRDIFQQARQAKQRFEQDLSAAKISRFDRNNKSLVRDVLENKIDPEVLVERITSSRSYRAQDLRQLRDYLQQTESGVRAFDDLRAQVLDNIKRKAFTGPEDANGVRALSRASLERQLDRIGTERLNVLFTTPERSLINNILKVAKLREPARGTALGQGPSAQAVISLRQQLANNSIVASLLDVIDVNRNGQVVLRGRVEPVTVSVGSGAEGAVPAALSAQQQGSRE